MRSAPTAAPDFAAGPGARQAQPQPLPLWQHLRRQRLALSLMLFCALLVLAPPRAGDQGLAIPVRYSQVRLGSRAPSLIRLDLPAGEYYVAPASLGYFSQNNEFVYTSDVQRGLIYGYIAHDPAVLGGDGRGAVYVVEIAAPSESDLFMEEYLKAIRERVNRQNMADNQLRIARERNEAEPLKSRRLAAQPLCFTRQELADGSFGNWVEQVVHDYPDLLGDMPSALQSETVDQVELKRLYYQQQAAMLDQMLASFELQMTLARLPKPRIESLLNVGDTSSVQSGGAEQLDRLRAVWNQRQQELQQELAQSRQYEDKLGSPGGGRQPFGGLGSGGGQLPFLPATGATDSRTALKRAVIDGRNAIAEAELTQIKDMQRLADGLERYMAQGGAGQNSGFKLMSVPRSSFELLSAEQLPDFALVEHLAADQGAGFPLLLKLARCFEGLDDAHELRLPSMQRQESMDAGESELAYGLLLLDRNRRARGSRPDSSEGGSVNTPQAPDMTAQLAYVLADPSSAEMADSNLGFVAFMSWYCSLPLSSPALTQAAASSPAVDTPAVSRQSAGGRSRQPVKSSRAPGGNGKDQAGEAAPQKGSASGEKDEGKGVQAGNMPAADKSRPPQDDQKPSAPSEGRGIHAPICGSGWDRD